MVKIVNSRTQNGDTILESAQSVIAIQAEQATDSPGRMIMVDIQILSFSGLRLIANCTKAILLFDHIVIILKRQFKAMFQGVLSQVWPSSQVRSLSSLFPFGRSSVRCFPGIPTGFTFPTKTHWHRVMAMEESGIQGLNLFACGTGALHTSNHRTNQFSKIFPQRGTTWR